MKDYNQLRKEFNKQVKKLQKSCKHKKIKYFHAVKTRFSDDVEIFGTCEICDKDMKNRVSVDKFQELLK